jgi:hypothetical protein
MPVRLRRSLTLLVLVALVAGAVYLAVGQIGRSQILVRERCGAVVGSETYELDPEQSANAALISAISVRRGLPARAASIALATAVQESKLRNIDYGDDAGPDSRGLFQQRPSQGWGTEAQVMDPVYSANRFFDELVKFDGYQDMDVTEAAQKVQRSAYPKAYADHEPEGRAFASALTGHSPASLNCVLKPADAAGSPERVQEQLARAYGSIRSSVDNGTVSVPAVNERGWSIAQWAVANARELQLQRVGFAGLVWDRGENAWAPADTAEGFVVIEPASAAG